MLRYQSFVVNFVQEVSYLIWDETGIACLIDPGFSSPKEAEQLRKVLQDDGLRLVRSIATHRHFDHLLGIELIAKDYGILTEVPEQDLREMPGLTSQLRAFGVPMGSEEEQPYEKPLQLDGADYIKVGEEELQVLHTPGHTPGHVIFYSKGSGLLFTGDLLFRNGFGRYDLWGGNYTDLMHSLTEVAFKLPNETIVLPGHGPKTTIGEEKCNF